MLLPTMRNTEIPNKVLLGKTYAALRFVPEHAVKYEY